MNIVSYAFSRFVGIDVSKETLDIASAECQSATIGNTRKAINTWINSLLETANTIVDLMNQEQNRLQQTVDRGIRKSIETVVGSLKKQLKVIEGQIEKAVQADEPNARKVEIQNSVKGVGPVTVSTLVAELPELGQPDRSHEKALDYPQCPRQVESTVESTNTVSRKMSVRKSLSERSGSSIDAPSN